MKINYSADPLWLTRGPQVRKHWPRQSSERWAWNFEPYAPVDLYHPGRFLVLMSVRGWVNPRAIAQLEAVGKWTNFNYRISFRTRDIPACSIAFQPTTLPRAAYNMWVEDKIKFIKNKFHHQFRIWKKFFLWFGRIFLKCCQIYWYITIPTLC
jgi:hypothetical protein